MALRFVIAATACSAACGRIDFGAPTGQDAAGDSTCLTAWLDHSVTMTAPAKLANVNIAGVGEQDPFPTPDQLELYWTAHLATAPSRDYFHATRATIADDFSAPIADDENLDSPADDARVYMTSNLLTAVVASTRGNGSTTELYISTRTAASDPYPTFTQTGLDAINLPNNSDSQTQDPWISDDLTQLYYTHITGGASSVIAAASRATADDAFGTPGDVAALASGGIDGDPDLVGSQRVIVFSSLRSGRYAVWYATRASGADDFGEPVQLPGLGDGASQDPMLSADACTIYYTSDSSDAAGDVWSAHQ